MKSTSSRKESLASLLQILEREMPLYLQQFSIRNIDPPSFRSSPTPTLSATVPEADISGPKESIILACEKIVALLREPAVHLTLEASGHLTSASISIALKLRLPHLISSDPNHPSSLGDLAQETGASPELLNRVLRYLTRQFIFEEIAPSLYVQNRVSKDLASPTREASIDLMTSDYLRSSAVLSDLIAENGFNIPPDSQHTAFSRAFQTNQGLYDYYSLEAPERGHKFALSMSGRPSGPHVLYPYADLPAGSQVVDVGGGSGHIAVPLARQYPHLRFIVQDSEGPIEYGSSIYGSEGLSIEWQKTDFFSQQPVKGAKVYLLRHILVDHPDGAAARILSCIAGAMNKESCILVEDAVVPNRYGEKSDRLINVIDMSLLSMFNSKERSMEQWKQLVGSADKNLEIVSVRETANTIGGETLLEIRLKR